MPRSTTTPAPARPRRGRSPSRQLRPDPIEAENSPPATPKQRRQIAATLLLFAVAFTLLAVNSYRRTSATWDEPIHLTHGYLALTRSDYRTDPEHPPFLRMWAALPLLAVPGIRADTSIIDRPPPTDWAFNTLFPFSHRFMYRDNDADALLYRSRFMIVLLGVVLGVLVFCWAYEAWGFRAALMAIGLYTIEPNIAAHTALVTTDLGFACFLFGTVYFLWRTCRRVTIWNLAGLAGFFALAVVSKFSALILVPLVPSLLAFAVWKQQTMRPRAAIIICVCLGLTTWVAIWAAYGFHYAPGPSGQWLFRFQDDPAVNQSVPHLARLIAWIDDRHWLPNAFTQGFLIG